MWKEKKNIHNFLSQVMCTPWQTCIVWGGGVRLVRTDPVMKSLDKRRNF